MSTNHFAKEIDAVRPDQLVVVNVHAKWCVPCLKISKRLDADFRRRPDVALLRIDFDENKHLARSLGIKSLPSFVLIKNNITFETITTSFEKYESKVLDTIDAHR
jgi:thioredoxin 1